jgi:hypothetical protein
MMRVIRVLSVLGLGTVTMLITLSTVVVPQAAGALTPPRSGVVEVTGFGRVGLDGNSGPVVVVVKGRRAMALRTALAGLAPKSSPSDCMETLIPFTVSFLPSKGARPSMVASAFNCDGPGVSVVVDHSTTSLQDDCAFQSAAIAALPRSRAKATRRIVTTTCPDGGSQ